MYAVFQAGGHQIRGKEGDVVQVDKLSGNVGDTVTFDKVFMIGGSANKFGAPLVAGATVSAKIKTQFRDDKILVLKYLRRKNSKKLRGHRQPVTEIEITKING